LKKNFLIKKENLRKQVYKLKIGDFIEVAYFLYGERRSIKKFRGLLIARIGNYKTLSYRIILLRRLRRVTIKFCIDINSLNLIYITKLINNSVLIRRNKFVYMKHYF